MRDISFEFRLFPEVGAEESKTDNYRDVAAARRVAGRLARGISGPVDLAYAGDEPWSERYISTASPSDYTASGYRFERLES